MNTPTPTSVNETSAHSGEQGKPSDRAIAEAFREWFDPNCQSSEQEFLSGIEARARELERSEALDRKHEQSEPAGDVVVTRDAAGAIVAVTRQDSEGRILSTIATAPPPNIGQSPREQAGIADDAALPELPEPVSARALAAWGPTPDYYTADQMTAYARVALQSAFPRGVGSDSEPWEMRYCEQVVAMPRTGGLDVQWSPEYQAAAGDKLYLHPQPSFSEKPSQNGDTPSASETPSADAWFAFPGDAIAHGYKAKWDAERGLYVSNDPPMVTHPMQEPVGHVRKHTGEFKDMAIIVWTNEQPPEGAALYLGPSAHTAEVNEPYPYRWRKPGQRWQYMRHPNREAFNEVMRDLKECGFEVERTGDFDAAIAAQRKGES